MKWKIVTNSAFRRTKETQGVHSASELSQNKGARFFSPVRDFQRRSQRFRFIAASFDEKAINRRVQRTQ